MSEKREAGWYWCKDSYGDDLPLYWCGERWLTSDDYSCDSAYLKRVLEVGPRIPTPDEPWQTVPMEPDLAMQKAYFESIDRHMQRVQTDLRFGRFDNQRLAYRAMLSAAPKPGGE
ncbi:hypothetical protein ACFQH5_20120 [Halomonas salifodinae]|uniref:Uncharacterized protein n=1 Tax=Halomonas salifodinae TaxID=438745 RepID=A0ABW2F1D1_9GAMM